MATRQARNIVRNILGTAETPLSTKQIYDLAWKKFPKATIEPSQWTYGNPQMKLKTNYERKEPPLPPRPITHPIPSMKHLKTRVLPSLAARSEVEKFLTVRAAQATHEKATDSRSKGKNRSTADTSSSSHKAWLWRIHSDSSAKPVPISPDETEWKWEAPAKPAPKTHAQMYPLPQNIHLNARRRRARPRKVNRERVWIAEVAKAMEAGKEAAAANQQDKTVS